MARDLPLGTFFFRKTTSKDPADAIAGSKKFFRFFGLHELSLHKSGFPSSLQVACHIELINELVIVIKCIMEMLNYRWRLVPHKTKSYIE